MYFLVQMKTTVAGKTRISEQPQRTHVINLLALLDGCKHVHCFPGNAARHVKMYKTQKYGGVRALTRL